MSEWRQFLPEFFLGHTFTEITGGVGDDEIRFVRDDGAVGRLYHKQDCCETVQVQDITGDLGDLVGSPVLLAEEVQNESKDVEYGSETWTFYKFATARGRVTVRWLGESNGYYSESVDFSVEDAR